MHHTTASSIEHCTFIREIIELEVIVIVMVMSSFHLKLVVNITFDMVNLHLHGSTRYKAYDLCRWWEGLLAVTMKG